MWIFIERKCICIFDKDNVEHRNKHQQQQQLGLGDKWISSGRVNIKPTHIRVVVNHLLFYCLSFLFCPKTRKAQNLHVLLFVLSLFCWSFLYPRELTTGDPAVLSLLFCFCVVLEKKDFVKLEMQKEIVLWPIEQLQFDIFIF